MSHRMTSIGIAAAALLATGCLVEEELGGVDEDELGSQAQAATGSTGYQASPNCPCINPPYDCWTGLQCDEGCIGTGYSETVWKWAFAATNYQVNWWLDNLLSIPGRHVGAGIIDEYGVRTFDKNRTWTNQGYWYTGYWNSYPYRSLIYNTANHGRTINTSGLTSGTLYNGMANANYVSVATFHVSRGWASSQRLQAIDQCLSTAMTDGFCDRMCGNDAYTIPPASQAPRTLWSFKAFNQRRVYEPYYPSYWSQVAINSGVVPWVAPTYGHNSNTDAVAEKTMFDKCRGFISQIQSNCNAPQNVASTIRTYVVDTCTSVCKMYRTGSSQWPSTDSNQATYDSGLGKYVGNIDDNWGPMGPPAAGSYDSGPWGYAVPGM